MKTTLHTFSFWGLTLALTLLATLPFLAFAQSSTGVNNPLNSLASTIPTFIATALKAMVMVALPILTLFLVISGFKFITAQGKPSELDTAKRNFYYVIIGAILILGAWVIATMIAGTVTQLTR